MTEDEAIKAMKSYVLNLWELPEEFHTKEFVLKLINCNVYLTFYEISECGVFDYDIALALFIHNGMTDRDLVYNSIYPKLSDGEIGKLKVTLDLMK